MPGQDVLAGSDWRRSAADHGRRLAPRRGLSRSAGRADCWEGRGRARVALLATGCAR